MVTSLWAAVLGLAIAALVIGAVQIAALVRILQARLDEDKKDEAPLSPQRPMLSGLYPAVSPGSEEPSMPGMRWLIAAGGLGVVGMLLGLVPSRPADPKTPLEIVVLGARIDSLTAVLAQRETRDSIAALKQVVAPARAGRVPSRPIVASRTVPAAITPPLTLFPDSAPIKIPGQ